MARTKSTSDDEIFGHLLQAIAEDGEKAATFGVISKRSGLAPATLAQRYGSVDGMVEAALLWEWSRLSDAVVTIEADALNSTKGAQALLKQVPTPTPLVLALSLRHASTQAAAQHWRALVETALAARRGGGSKGRESAALIFAAWQGRQIWEDAGGKSFRLAELLKALP